MPRELKPIRNAIEVLDPVSGDVLTFYHRLPTPREHVLYRAEQLEREGSDIIQAVFETRLKYGLAILTGVKAGDLTVEGAPLSADPAAPGYRADWRDLLAEAVPEIVTAIAFRVFEGAKVLRSYEDKPAAPLKAEKGLTGQVVEEVQAPLAAGSGAA